MSWQCDKCDQAHLKPTKTCDGGFPVPEMDYPPLPWWQIVGWMGFFRDVGIG